MKSFLVMVLSSVFHFLMQYNQVQMAWLKPLSLVKTPLVDHATVFHLLDEPAMGKLHVVGRLDLDTTGLVLITDDGQWSHRITSPRHECAKTYHVWLADPVSEEAISLFADGIYLRNENDKTRPAELEILDDREARLTIHEGKYHLVKRMFSAIGNKVV